MKAITVLLLIVSILAPVSLSANILALLPLDILSNHVFGYAIIKELAIRGHNVVLLTSIEDLTPPPNLKQVLMPRKSVWDAKKVQDIWISLFQKMIERLLIYPTALFGENGLNAFCQYTDEYSFFEAIAVKKPGQIPKPEGEEKLDPGSETFYAYTSNLWNATLTTTEYILSSPGFKEFVEKDKSHFDLIIYDIFHHEAFLMLGHKYNAPIIGLSAVGSSHTINQYMGNPYELSYATHERLELSGRLKFFDRFRNTYWTMVDLFERSRYLLSEHQELAQTHFTNLSEPLPSISELERNISLVLVNSHFSINGPRTNVPGIVEVAGLHIKGPQPLPKDIKKFMDEASDGVIYFSLGSRAQSSEMPEEDIKAFTKVFAGLKERIIWKWDADKLPEKSGNILYGKWLPQADILAHPKMKLFITQCGVLSMQEAIVRSVPVIGIPVYNDQFTNCAMAKRNAFAEILQYRQLSEDSIKTALKKVLNDFTYKQAAKRISVVFEDRPATPMQTAIYWIEYVIRYKGAPQLDSPARDLSWYEYYQIDVYMCMGICVYYTYYTLSWLFWNVALRKKIVRDDLKDLIEKQKAH